MTKKYDVPYNYLRELTFLEEEAKQVWAGKMKALLLEIKHTVQQATTWGQTRMDVLIRLDLVSRYQEIVAEGYAANPAF